MLTLQPLIFFFIREVKIQQLSSCKVGMESSIKWVRFHISNKDIYQVY